jgi:asparagine synthase (glutamine-hydrolysing)
MKAAAPHPRRETLDTWLASFSDAPLSDTPYGDPGIAEIGKRLRLTTLSTSGRLSAANEANCETVFDGWLYNRNELISELAAPAKTANAALMVRAYLRWGEGALNRLRGIFALCIWDAGSQTLLGARDPLGVYPLFYARAGHEWFFSTSVDALLQHPSVPKAVNRTALATYLLRKYRDIEETYFLSIRRVPPGHVLKVVGEGRRIQAARYWHPFPSKGMVWAKEDDLEQFPVLMKQAIGRCFQLGRAGIYLSGGLDSGTVASLAAEYAQEKLLPLPYAISLVYEDSEANEERIQRGIAGYLGIPQTLVRHEQILEAGDIFSASLQLNHTWPHPLVVGLSPIHLMLGEQAREKGCDVVLSGEGGDEWLAIHYRLAADLTRSLDGSGLGRLWRTSKETGRDSWYGTTRRLLGVHGLWPLLQDGLGSSLEKLAPGTLRAHRRRSAEHNVPRWMAPDPELRENLYGRAEKSAKEAPSTFYQREIMDTILNQPLTVLYKEDNFECSRRTGVLMLEPFYDPEVIQFLVRTPPWLRCRGGRYKGLLRQLLHRRHPQLGYDRQQKPYATGFVSRKVFEGARRIWPAMKGAQALSKLGVVQAESTDAWITEILEKEDVGQLQRLWMTLCAEVWARSRI